MVKTIQVLLIEDNPSDAELIRRHLSKESSALFQLTTVERLSEALGILAERGFDAALLDLQLPDAKGEEIYAQVRAKAPDLPIIICTGTFLEEQLALDALKRGAQDYLSKDQLSGFVLSKAIRYSIERKSVEKELARARDMALELARLKSQFLANMSHEIRTPLTAIVGMADFLAEAELARDYREHLDILRRAADALMRTINDILDFSKIEAGMMKLERVPFDLRKLIEDACEMLAPAAQAKGVEMIFFMSPETPALLVGDPLRLRQVLVNLLSNAVKFTHVGEIVLEVFPRRGIPGNGRARLRFEVRDTGIGVPAQAEAHLFEAFIQAQDSTSRYYGGTGLGLAICKKLVELMGGEIGYERRPGKGALFWFCMNLEKQSAGADAQAPEGDFAALRALVIDDNHTNRRILKEQLMSWTFRPSEAAGPAEALEILRAGAGRDPFGVILLDFQMPQMDGLALAREIRKLPGLERDPPIILMTSGASSPSAPETLRNLGIAAFLTKPVKKSTLYDCLIHVLTRLAEPAPRKPRRAKGPAKPWKLLLVEDNPVNQRVALLQLEKLGYENIKIAHNGREAVELILGQSFDIVLMDCQLPDMDGYKTAAEIRKLEGKSHHIPIVALTAHALEGDREKCLAAGMDDYLSKPVVMETLAQVLSRWEPPV
ncbi:MAG: response regulator [Elusimicrobia bacterium]|nr:response regulator [Elusimicrobiota bacterium]